LYDVGYLVGTGLLLQFQRERDIEGLEPYTYMWLEYINEKKDISIMHAPASVFIPVLSPSLPTSASGPLYHKALADF
jgi:hypothetical protein